MFDIDKNLEYIINTPLSNNFYSQDIYNKNLIFYGYGKLGEMALTLISDSNIKPKYIVDQNIQGIHNGIPIVNPCDIKEEDLESSIFVICISSISYNSISSFLRKLGCENIIQFYDFAQIVIPKLLSNGWEKFNLTNIDILKIKEVCINLNHDKNSLIHYFQFLWWRLKRIEKIYDNYPILSNTRYFDAPCFPKLSENENFLDAGAHHGTTINHFLNSTNKTFANIWAFEPDEKNLDILKKSIDESLKVKINIFNIALSNIEDSLDFEDNLGFASKIKVDGSKKVIVKKIDSLKLNPSIVKLHVEGNELQVLEGAKQIITIHRPIIMVLADHNDDGLYKIADFLINLKNYKLYFYLHDYCGNSAIFYAIPKERDKNEK